MKKESNIKDLTLLLNEVEEMGVDSIISSVDIDASYARINRTDGDICRMQVRLRAEQLNANVSAFFRDAVSNDPRQVFDISQLGTEGTTIDVSYIRNLSENYIDNPALQDDATKKITFLLDKILNKELSSLRDKVHGHELMDNKGVFSQTKESGSKSGVFGRLSAMISRATENTGFNL